MKSTPLTLPIKAGAAIGFIIMALVGWQLGDSTPEPAASSADATAPDPSARPTLRMRGPSDAAAQRMAVIHAGRDEGERMLATIQLASSLPPSEFAAWIDGHRFSLREGASQTLFNKILMERWQFEDPDGLLAWSIKNQSGKAASILDSWAGSDPQRMLDFFKQHPNTAAELRALTSLAKNSPDLALRRLLEMTQEGLSKNDTSNAYGLIQQLAKQSPASLEAALDLLPASMRADAERYVIREKLKTSFDVEIRKLYDRPDGINELYKILNMGDSGLITSKLFDELANFPASWLKALAQSPDDVIGRENGGKWVKADLEGMGFNAEQSNNIRTTAIRGMSYKHPQEALELLNSLEIPEQNRKDLINNIFGYHRDKPELTETLLAMLDSDEERAVARTTVKERSSQSENTKIEQPSDWLDRALSADFGNGSFYNLASMLRNWDQEKLAALSRGFNSMPDESKMKIAQNLVSIGYSDVGPLEAEATRYLVEHPAGDSLSNEGRPGITEDHKIQLASRYAGKMAQTDPTAASEWIQTLPAGTPKLWAQKNLHSLWSQYDPKAADEWMTTLPATERAKVKALGK